MVASLRLCRRARALGVKVLLFGRLQWHNREVITPAEHRRGACGLEVPAIAERGPRMAGGGGACSVVVVLFPAERRSSARAPGAEPPGAESEIARKTASRQPTPASKAQVS